MNIVAKANIGKLREEINESPTCHLKQSFHQGRVENRRSNSIISRQPDPTVEILRLFRRSTHTHTHKHNHATTKTQPQKHKNTTTPPQKHATTQPQKHNHTTTKMHRHTHTQKLTHARTHTQHKKIEKSTCHNSFQTMAHPSPPQNAHFTTVLNQKSGLVRVSPVVKNVHFTLFFSVRHARSDERVARLA